MTTPALSTGEGFKYAGEQIRIAIDQLRKGNDEITELVANLKSNVELNFEGWGGGSKEEFTRVHQETAAHITAIAGWLEQTRDQVQKILGNALQEDRKDAQRFNNA